MKTYEDHLQELVKLSTTELKKIIIKEGRQLRELEGRVLAATHIYSQRPDALEGCMTDKLSTRTVDDRGRGDDVPQAPSELDTLRAENARLKQALEKGKENGDDDLSLRLSTDGVRSAELPDVRQGTTAGVAGREPAHLQVSVLSEYWRCVGCGAVLHSPTTGRVDGDCWACHNQPFVIGERQPTVWEPIAKPTPVAKEAAESSLASLTAKVEELEAETAKYDEMREALTEYFNQQVSTLTGALSQLRETTTLVANSMGDVVTLGRFAKSVDPVRLVSDWHTDLCYAIHAALPASPSLSSPERTSEAQEQEHPGALGNSASGSSDGPPSTPINEAIRLLEQITPGEWIYNQWNGGVWSGDAYPSTAEICRVHDGDQDFSPNAEFIAAAPRLLRWFLAERDTLRAENARLREHWLDAADRADAARDEMEVWRCPKCFYGSARDPWPQPCPVHAKEAADASVSTLTAERERLEVSLEVALDQVSTLTGALSQLREGVEGTIADMRTKAVLSDEAALRVDGIEAKAHSAYAARLREWAKQLKALLPASPSLVSPRPLHKPTCESLDYDRSPCNCGANLSSSVRTSEAQEQEQDAARNPRSCGQCGTPGPYHGLCDKCSALSPHGDAPTERT